MKREIKFRIWDKNKMEYFGLAEAGPWVSKDATPPFYPKDWNPALCKDVMQYTGLKDKNGKEIYEGDIVKYEEPNFESGMVNGIVEYIGAGFCLSRITNDNTMYFDDLETVESNNDGKIIGNIYENPKLLK